MKLKLIVVLVDDRKTEAVIAAARDAGATGATTITSVRGEGRKPPKTFFGLEISSRRDVLLFVVAESRARAILEQILRAGRFDTDLGTGIAFQIDIEDAVGMSTQIPAIREGLREAEREGL